MRSNGRVDRVVQTPEGSQQETERENGPFPCFVGLPFIGPTHWHSFRLSWSIFRQQLNTAASIPLQPPPTGEWEKERGGGSALVVAGAAAPPCHRGSSAYDYSDLHSITHKCHITLPIKSES
jgi:hypothetical protein